MAYYTGTVASPALLKTVIETECVAAGWTLTGSWLSKGLSAVKFTAPDANYLQLNAACSADGTLNPAPFTHATWVRSTEWPVTYYLQINTNPDVVVCTIKHNTDRCQTLWFGDIVKCHTSAYVGGNFFFASGRDNSGTASPWETLPRIETTTFGFDKNNIVSGGDYYYAGNNPCIPFSAPTNQSVTVPTKGIHAEIDGSIWDLTGKSYWGDTTLAALFRSPNQWDSQADLVPINLVYAMASSLWNYLGYIEHIRLVRVTNYEIGDIITISPDKWQVFPFLHKNAAAPNGPGHNTSGAPLVAGHTGTLGFAVRYDGP